MEQQFDDMSRVIGQLEAYSREFRDGSTALTALITANELASCNRHEALRIEFMGHLERELAMLSTTVTDLSARVTSFETERFRRQGAVGVGQWFVKNWPVAGIISALAAIVAWANDKV